MLGNNGFIDVAEHYDLLIDEDNDPVHDPDVLKQYMDKRDGQDFINSLELSLEKTVLEIGIGTGRLAIKIAGKCKLFYGIDLSEKTVKRARQNLWPYSNTVIICDDFLQHTFTDKFDIIYSSLTFWHIQNKYSAILKAARLLNDKGIFVLAIAKEQNDVLDFGNRKLQMFPDNKDDILSSLKLSGLEINLISETELSYIIRASKYR